MKLSQLLCTLIRSFAWLWLVSCAFEPPIVPVPRAPMSETAPRGVDLDKLRTVLNVNSLPSELGFFEVQFDGCAHHVRDARGHCGASQLVVIHFQLLCRDSEDTVSEVAQQLTPVATRDVHWKLAGQEGHSQTDASGFAQVQLVGFTSLREQRLVLTVGNQFLGLEAAQAQKIVVPRYWCSESR